MPRIKPIKPKSKLRNRHPLTGLRQRVKPLRNIHKKGVELMTPVDFNKKYEVDDDNVNLDCVMEIRRIAQQSVKQKGLTEKQIRMSLGIKRYEK